MRQVWLKRSVWAVGAMSAGMILWACATLPAPIDPVNEPTYEPVTPGSMTITLLDNTLTLPSRIKITPNGETMFVTELTGRTVVFRKTAGVFVRQQAAFFDLSPLNVDGERGLTAVFFRDDFDPTATETHRRDVFLSNQSVAAGDDRPRNRLTRVTATINETGDLVGTAPQDIYVGADRASFAHQIQDGFALDWQGAPHVLFQVGDGFEPGKALDPAATDRGKFLLMQRDGSNPLGERPWPAFPLIQAVGLRNAYGTVMVPATRDVRQRIIGAENGNARNDRVWFMEVLDFGGEINAQVSFGYTGSDIATSWTQVPDVNNVRSVKPEGVIALLSPAVGPTCVDLHPGKGIIPTPNTSQVTFLLVNYGKTESRDNSPGKEILVGIIDDIDSQPTATLTPIIRRKPSAEGQLGNPVALAVDQTNGDFYFSDILTGELNRVVVAE